MIKSSFEDYDKKHNDIASKISKAIADYSVFIEVLNENNYHQKINPTEMIPTKSPAI